MLQNHHQLIAYLHMIFFLQEIELEGDSKYENCADIYQHV